MVEDHTGCNFVQDQCRLGVGSRVERHMVFPGFSLKKGAVAPGESWEVLFPTLDFADGRDDEATMIIHVPFRRLAGSNIEIKLTWMHDTVAKVGKVLWKATYLSAGCGDASNAAGTTISVLTAGSHAQDTILCDSMTTGILSANLTADDDLVIKIWRDGNDATDTLTEAARLISVHVHFTMDKFGNDI